MALAVTKRDLAFPLARRAPVVHLSAGCSQRPLGVTVEDSLGTALFSQDAASVEDLVEARAATYGTWRQDDMDVMYVVASGCIGAG